jgi:hypothetical protein
MYRTVYLGYCVVPSTNGKPSSAMSKLYTCTVLATLAHASESHGYCFLWCFFSLTDHQSDQLGAQCPPCNASRADAVAQSSVRYSVRRSSVEGKRQWLGPDTAKEWGPFRLLSSGPPATDFQPASRAPFLFCATKTARSVNDKRVSCTIAQEKALGSSFLAFPTVCFGVRRLANESVNCLFPAFH